MEFAFYSANPDGAFSGVCVPCKPQCKPWWCSWWSLHSTVQTLMVLSAEFAFLVNHSANHNGALSRVCVPFFSRFVSGGRPPVVRLNHLNGYRVIWFEATIFSVCMYFSRWDTFFFHVQGVVFNASSTIYIVWSSYVNCIEFTKHSAWKLGNQKIKTFNWLSNLTRVTRSISPNMIMIRNHSFALRILVNSHILIFIQMENGKYGRFGLTGIYVEKPLSVASSASDWFVWNRAYELA